MDDFINRQAAIDGILQFMPTKLRDDATLEEQINYVAWRCALGCAVSSVGTQPSAQPEPRWIPCSERLPVIENNIGKRVLVTTSWGLVTEAWFCKDHWEIHDMPYKLTSVIAWMPLPEPWKGESDG